MSRIRTVKPEFWTSEQVMSCLPIARLLFIGLWNFSDDHGVHPASFVRIKAEVFPADNFSIEEIERWINELISADLLHEYTVNNKNYWIVTGWEKHQRIDKPTYRHPLPLSEIKKIGDNSSNTQQILDDTLSIIPQIVADDSTTDRNGKDRNGKEEDIHHSSNNNHTNCPHENIIALYHELLPMCRPVRTWNNTRQRYLKQRWSEKPEHQNVDWWKNYFSYIKQSKFLTGQIEGRNGNPNFIADLEWLVKPNNFAKIIEGKYHEVQS
jgi:hypothetical protein